MSLFQSLVGSLTVEQFSTVVGFIFGLNVFAFFVSWLAYDVCKSIFLRVGELMSKRRVKKELEK